MCAAACRLLTQFLLQFSLLDFGVFFQCVRVPCMPGSAQASLERTVCCGLTAASVCLYCRVIALISDQVK